MFFVTPVLTRHLHRDQIIKADDRPCDRSLVTWTIWVAKSIELVSRDARIADSGLFRSPASFIADAGHIAARLGSISPPSPAGSPDGATCGRARTYGPLGRLGLGLWYDGGQRNKQRNAPIHGSAPSCKVESTPLSSDFRTPLGLVIGMNQTRAAAP
jgi:hypothetical protein